jgi:hypothetical protein
MEPIARPSSGCGEGLAGQPMNTCPAPLERVCYGHEEQAQQGGQVTLLRFSGGEAIEVSLTLGEVQELLQQAIAEGRMLELHAPDGRVLVVNPQQVQYLQNAEDVEADARAGARDGAEVPARA